ncbi:MAG: SLBB domain-containing protein [bacterium]|nr:SLBB domain-containing protein [bacterium]
MAGLKNIKKRINGGFPFERGSCHVLLLIFLVSACSPANHFIVPDNSEPLGAVALGKATRETVDVPPIPSDPGPYRVGPGDILLIRDLDHPELFAVQDNGFLTLPLPELFVGEMSVQTLGMNQFVVQDNGFLTLPLVGLSPAEGRTLADLQVDLNIAYGQFVIKPNISVTVSNFRSQKIYVLGQVNIPGAFPFDGRIALLDAIGMAQGLNQRSDLMGSYVIRGEELLPVDLYALLRRGDLRHNIRLIDGDLIQIADSADRKVYVLGEVQKPGVFPMGAEPLRLIDAISMAGGLEPRTAQKGGILLVRGGYADPTVYKLDLSDVMSLTGAETILEPGDRIYATATGLTNWSRIMVQLLPFLQGGESAIQMYNDLK